MKIYQVDAFAESVFTGNPAAVCPLESWLSDELLQKIAMENNLAETAFYVHQQGFYEIRWFTPTVEVALCGHATLATAFVLFNFEGYEGDSILFKSRQSGDLLVAREEDRLILNFPADTIEKVEDGINLQNCFNISPLEIWKGKTDYMFIFENESQIKNLIPNLLEIAKSDCRGIIVTAKGEDADFVSRFFAPQSGINEDPVTGSAHTTLMPYWSAKLGKNELSAIQLSSRKGFLNCKKENGRILISGKAKLYLYRAKYLWIDKIILSTFL